MDLEQRVTMLEQEVQILKNQIQATLLDVQEHLLSNAYPSLRAEAEEDASQPPSDPAPVKTISITPDALEALEEPAPRVAPEASEAFVPDPAPRKPSPPEPEPDRRDLPARHMAPMPAPSAMPRRSNGAAHMPKVTPFVLDEDFPTGPSTDTPITSADWALMEQLVEWTNRRVNLFGARHTRALIRRYTAEGRISPDVRDALLQIVAIGAARPDGPDSEPMTITLASNSTQNDRPGKGPDEHVSSNLIMRLIAGITAVGNGRSRSAKNHG